MIFSGLRYGPPEEGPPMGSLLLSKAWEGETPFEPPVPRSGLLINRPSILLFREAESYNSVRRIISPD